MADKKRMRILAVIFTVAVFASACAGGAGSPPDALAAGSGGGEASVDANESRQLGGPGEQGNGESADSPDETSTLDAAESGTVSNTDTGDATASVENAAPALESFDEASNGGTSAGDSSAGSASEPAAQSSQPSSQDPLDRLVTELIAFVEDERGLDFVERPDVVVLDSGSFNDEWRQVVVRDVGDNVEEFAEFTDIYQAVGIIDDGSELDEIWTRFGDAGVVGFYDIETKDIVLRGGELNKFTETVLVHELVHALEDQVFGLDRDDEFAARIDEIDWTFSALIEGSARVIEGRYRARFSQAELDEENAARNSIPRSVSLSDFTSSFLELQFGRYNYGEDFAASLWDVGQGELDDALVNPPVTSESVVNPESFLSGADDLEEMPFPPADGEIFERGTWGQAGIAALLADVYGQSEALELSQGWGSDRFVAWRSGDIACVRLHVSADSPEALDRYADAFEDWAQLGDRQVFFPTADLIRVTSCG